MRLNKKAMVSLLALMLISMACVPIVWVGYKNIITGKAGAEGQINTHKKAYEIADTIETMMGSASDYEDAEIKINPENLGGSRVKLVMLQTKVQLEVYDSGDKLLYSARVPLIHARSKGLVDEGHYVAGTGSEIYPDIKTLTITKGFTTGSDRKIRLESG